MTESNQDDTPSASAPEPTNRKPIRWWPAAVVMLLGLAVVIGVRLWPKTSFQEKNIATAQVVLVTLLLQLLWVLFFSRLRWRIRLTVFGSVLGVIALTAGLFKIRGVTGDLLPILEWRWTQPRVIALTGSKPLPPASHENHFVATTNDFPQFLGPNRNAQVAGPKLARDWKAQPPQKLWSQPIGAAWSGFAVLGNYSVTQEQRGEEELVVCYDLPTGKALWSHADNAHYNTTIAGEGPRATPTIVSNRVFTLGATGILNCLNLESGERIWTKDILKDNQAGMNGWGMSGSPLVLNGMVIVSAGGANGRSLVAYDVATGNFIWGGGDDGASYSSPILATLAGADQILIFNSHQVAAHNPASGQVLWEYKWPAGHPHVAIPVMLPEDRVLVTSGYGTGAELLQIKKPADDPWSASRIWKSIRLKAKFTNVVYRDGFIYGLDDGILVCLDAVDGSLKWKEGRYGHGQVTLTGDVLLIMDEGGEVVLVEPVPQEHRELTRFRALPGKTWNPPALAGEHLVVRNDKEAACFRLPLAKE